MRNVEIINKSISICVEQVRRFRRENSTQNRRKSHSAIDDQINSSSVGCIEGNTLRQRLKGKGVEIIQDFSCEIFIENQRDKRCNR